MGLLSSLSARLDTRSELGSRYEAFTAWVGIDPGDRPLESGEFQIFFAIYTAASTWFLIRAAASRAKGVGGDSWLLVAVVFGGWFAAAFLMERIVQRLSQDGNNWPIRFILSLVAGVLFVFGLIESIQMGLWQGISIADNGMTRVFKDSVRLYGAVMTIVFLALQRRISPDADTDGDLKERFQLHLNNSWRLFQIVLSVAVAGTVGFLLPLGLVMVRKYDVIFNPLGYFIGGLLLSIVLLSYRLWREIQIFEEHELD